MKNILALIFAIVSFHSFAQSDTLKASQAKEYIGKEIIVKDIIAGARLFERPEKITFLVNLSDKYPNTPLTIVLYDEIYKGLEPKENLEGKTIVVKGIVSVFNEKIQLVITDLKNIKIF